MPDTITTAFVQEYKANVEMLLQQAGSRFRGAVTTDSYTGKAASAVEQFGETAAQKKTSRHGDTPILDVPQAKRWVFPVDYEWGSMIDNTDKLRMIIDPTSPYAISGRNAMARSQDDEIITGFFATAKVGENGTTDEDFDTSNYRVGVDVGGTASSINVAKLQSALQKLMLAHKGEVTEMIYCGISSYEHDALLKEIQVISKDYNGGTAVLENGRVKRFMGMDFIITERLNITSGDRLIPIWVPTGMHLGFWQDMVAEVSKRADKSYNWQVYLAQTIGATRLQQGKVIQVLCDDQI
jgi:hypothetical protein